VVREKGGFTARVNRIVEISHRLYNLKLQDTWIFGSESNNVDGQFLAVGISSINTLDPVPDFPTKVDPLLVTIYYTKILLITTNI
jgi:hypothetical protein